MSNRLNQTRRLAKSAALLAFLSACGAALAAPPKDSSAPDPLPPYINTNEVVVRMVSGAFADALAKKHNIAVKGNLREQPDWVIFTTPSVADALAVEKALKSDPMVVTVENNRLTKHTKFQAFTPNDPYYTFNNPAGFEGQWHLAPNASGRPNVNAQLAWAQGITGNGVIIGICDDGLQHAHPDLSPNYRAAQSFDFGQNDGDPTPVNANDNHGTSVSGVAAARGGNAIGGLGAAPLAGLAGLRLDFGSSTAAAFANATLYRSSGAYADRQIGVKNHSYGVSTPYIPTVTEDNAFTTSALAGTIHTISAGNNRGTFGEDSTMLMVQNNVNVLCVAALGGNGKYASYSNFGACVFVTASSNSFDPAGLPGITTTDRTANDGYNDAANDPFPDTNYTSTFGGTSSSAPLVAGVMALLKQRAPAADARLAKHMLARTSKVVDPWDASASSFGGWKTNGAGFRFNPNYGFGNVHTGDLINSVRNYYNAAPRTTRVIGPTAVGAAIPDNDLFGGVVRTFTTAATPGGVPLEEIQIRLRATHTYRGDLTAFIRSPYGTTHRVMGVVNDGTDNLDWTFTVNGFYGENPAGTWTIAIYDGGLTDTGTWTDYTVTMFMGAPASKLGSNILTYDAGNNMQFNALVNGKSYANQSLPSKPAGFTPVAVGDIDRDGRNDIVLQNAGQNISVMTMFGYFSKATTALGVTGAGFRAIAVADIDKNGFGDIVVWNAATRQVGYHPILVAGPALGAMVPIGVAPVGTVAVGAADFTGDGQPDIMLDKTTAARAVWVWQLNAGGTPFGILFSGFQATGFTLLGLGDINYDGQPDFIARNTANGSVAGYTMNVLTVTSVATLTTIPAGHTPVGAAPL